MVYRFIMLSDENDFFRREYLINSDATFLTFNDYILSSVGYDKSELSSFYLCDDEWNKEQEVTLLDMGMGAEYDSYLMEETPLEELIESKGSKLLFVYDMLSERAFFLELAEIKPGQNPEIVSTICSEGNAPAQRSSIEFAESRSVGGPSLVIGEDFLEEEEGIDLDELDADGFEGLSPGGELEGDY